MTQAQRVFEAVMRGKGHDDFTKSPTAAKPWAQTIGTSTPARRQSQSARNPSVAKRK
jgi:hypothetical protein